MVLAVFQALNEIKTLGLCVYPHVGSSIKFSSTWATKRMLHYMVRYMASPGMQPHQVTEDMLYLGGSSMEIRLTKRHG